jgi:hypothetical protein
MAAQYLVVVWCLVGLLTIGAVGVDHSGEWILEEHRCNVIHNIHPERNADTCYATLDQRSAQEGHSTTDIHRVVKDIEWESSDWSIHQNTTIVTEESTSDTKTQERAPYEYLTNSSGCITSILDIVIQKFSCIW